jgi:hypothetical protein
VSNGDQKILVTIHHWGYVGWWPNFFGHHLIHPHYPMTIVFFWSPKKAWGERHLMTTSTREEQTKKEKKKNGKKRGKKKRTKGKY